MSKFIIATILAGTLLTLTSRAQEPKRPRLLGVSKIVVRSHDLNASRHFYGELLGFQEAITILKNQTAVAKSGLPQDQVSSIFFKVNDRQYIVVMPESSTTESRYGGYAIETDNAEAMRLFLKSLGYAVPAKVTRTPTHDLAFQISDPEGDQIEIMQYTPESLSVQNAGKDLAEDRLSRRMLHTGFTITKPASMKFYLEGLDVREFWRADPTMKALGVAPGPRSVGPLLASLSNLKLPESDDYVELSISRPRPNVKAPARGTGGHIALLTPFDMARTVAAVEGRPAFKDYTRRHESHIGVNHKWQGNYFDPDGTRVEFMELDTANGLPSPMSYAPYF